MGASIIAGSVLMASNKMALVSSGGDTDTNGALAGAVLGTLYGAGAMPISWTSHIAQWERLVDLTDWLVRL